MRLYYFTTEQWGLKAIRDSRLKIARIDKLNDPLDSLGLSLPDRENREERIALRKWRKAMSKKHGLICMSKNWRDPLLWSHYAEKHHGLCLGFDCTDKKKFKHVRYFAARPTLRYFGRKRFADLDESDLNKLLHIKSKAWKYESEYRALCPLKDCDSVDPLHFVPFSAEMKLVQVIVGERSNLEPERLAQCLGERDSTFSSFKARSGFRKFEVVKNTREIAWPYFAPHRPAKKPP